MFNSGYEITRAFFRGQTNYSRPRGATSTLLLAPIFHNQRITRGSREITRAYVSWHRNLLAPGVAAQGPLPLQKMSVCLRVGVSVCLCVCLPPQKTLVALKSDCKGFNRFLHQRVFAGPPLHTT